MLVWSRLVADVHEAVAALACCVAATLPGKEWECGVTLSLHSSSFVDQ